MDSKETNINNDRLLSPHQIKKTFVNVSQPTIEYLQSSFIIINLLCAILLKVSASEIPQNVMTSDTFLPYSCPKINFIKILPDLGPNAFKILVTVFVVLFQSYFILINLVEWALS